MLQRIQTMYLSLSVISLALLLFFPLAAFYSEQLGSYRFYITGIRDMTHAGVVPFPAWYFSPLMVVALTVAVMATYTISLYKSRPKQIQLTNIAIMLNILLILGILYLYIPLIKKNTGIEPEYAKYLGIYLPVIALMFLVLANRAIKRDEKLIRSSDRLR